MLLSHIAKTTMNNVNCNSCRDRLWLNLTSVGDLRVYGYTKNVRFI